MPNSSLLRLKYNILILLLFIIPLTGALAQGITVKGKFTDDLGQGVPGVNVLLKSTTTGTSTDGNGDYFLAVPIVEH